MTIAAPWSPTTASYSPSTSRTRTAQQRPVSAVTGQMGERAAGRSTA
jgi:hypothetical protein